MAAPTDSWQRQASRQLRRKGKSGVDSVNARVCKGQRTNFAQKLFIHRPTGNSLSLHVLPHLLLPP
jgi:hypothetical protein